MTYKERICKLLEDNMTERAFKLWSGINRRVPDIWDKVTASTRKYHRKLNGEVPSCAEHVYHMLYSSIKIMKLFGFSPKSIDCDKILFAVALHDVLKYGELGTRVHTDNRHDKASADMICSNKSTFLKLFSEEQFSVLEEAVRFHSGRWSTDAKYEKDFNFKNYNPETLFIHMLDMMSTQDLIQTDVRE